MDPIAHTPSNVDIRPRAEQLDTNSSKIPRLFLEQLGTSSNKNPELQITMGRSRISSERLIRSIQQGTELIYKTRYDSILVK
jgi:hypothetical protein